MAPFVREAGIPYQADIQSLVGGANYGADLRRSYDWEFMADQRGNECGGMLCPIGPRFREKARAMLRLWAGTRPDVL